MIAETETPIIIDTNVIIEFAKWQPVLLSEVFWRKMAESLGHGKWMLLDVVAKEIKYNDPLLDWIKLQEKNSLIKKLEDAHKDRAVEVNNIYPMIHERSKRSEVDTYIIAYAEASNCKVFSEEAAKGVTQKYFKIPDVCRALKIQMITQPEEFLNAIGYKN